MKRQPIQFLRSSQIYNSLEEAQNAMKEMIKNSQSSDGELILFRYKKNETDTNKEENKGDVEDEIKKGTHF